MRLLSAAAATICLALPAGLAQAGPLTSERVPAGANFIVHVDFEGMQESKAGRALLSMLEDAEIDGLDDARDELGFDPIEALHDITVSGTDDDGADVVIVATGHDELLEALDRLREEADSVREMSRDGVEFLQFAGDGDDDDHHMDAINIWTRESRDGVTIIASPDVDALVSGVRTFRGREDGADIDGAPRNSFVVVMAHSLDGMDAGPASALLQMSKGVMIDVGDDDGDLSINLRLHAEDDDGAKALVQMLQGVIAFAKVGLAEEMEDEGVLDLLDSLEFDSRGSAIRVHLSVDPDTLKDFIDN